MCSGHSELKMRMFHILVVSPFPPKKQKNKHGLKEKVDLTMGVVLQADEGGRGVKGTQKGAVIMIDH